MCATFLESLRLHCKWWLLSWTPRGRQYAPLTIQRLIFLLILYPAFCLLQLIHWGALFVDELVFPSYKKTSLKNAIFISGIPRSGTTFIHRALSSDRNQYFTISTWKAVIAPAICQQWIIEKVGHLDRLLGSPIKRLLAFLNQQITGSMEQIHPISLDAPEEDYLFLLPSGGCFILSIAFPFAEELSLLAQFEKLPSRRQKQLLDFYERLLQRQIYRMPSSDSIRFLSKNASFASWTQALSQRFPESFLVFCIRDPQSALTSQLSSIESARALFGTDPKGEFTTCKFTELFTQNYQALLNASKEIELCQIIDQNDLRNQTSTLLRSLIEKTNSFLSPSIEKLIDAQSGPYQSAHKHQASDFSLNLSKIDQDIRPHYDSLLNSHKRIKPD